MELHEIFAKPVDRYIEGVIKADDLEHLLLEVEEYVITNEITKRMEDFFNAYNDYQGANGVWISGFFGSGKSHLLKMLAVLLENKTIEGKSMLERFQPKADNEFLKGAMAKAVSFPSKSLLFNIDQKAVNIAPDEVDAILQVFVKVFNEMQGYYGRLGYVAQFERDLDDRGIYDEFQSAFQEIAGTRWDQGREQVILESKNVDQAYAKVSGEDENSSQKIIDKYREDYQLSIEDFAQMVKEYIDEQEPNFRLNFFVDEVGQFVADHIKLMTNLQTVAESLATICKGQAWLIVTAQEEMETVMGQFVTAQRDDFTKIMDRFKTRMKLTGANVDEVIKRRLLEKTDQSVQLIERIYDKEKNNFGTIFGFSEETDRFPKFKNKEDFVNSYPFIPYQFDLFQLALENLSRKNAFEGQHRSVGERSMLGVFQQVVVQIKEHDLGQLATFDQMYEGISTALKAQTQRSIINAEDVLDEFSIKVLKALLLVKYVKEFKATPRNLRVLLRDSFDLNMVEREATLLATLDALETQNFIQRKGEEYQYLTDEERDVQEAIKNTQVEQSSLTDEIFGIVFDEVISNRKLRYETTQQDFGFTRKIDDRILGKEQELTIHLITPYHDHINEPSILQGNSMGKAELMVVFPSDPRLMADLSTYKKTDTYIRQNSTTVEDDKQRILADQSFQNQQRHQEIRQRVRDLLKEARMIVSGNEIDIGGGDPKTRIHKGFERLIQTTYPNLKMIQGIQYDETEIKKYLELTTSGMFSGKEVQLNEAEGEILAFVNRNKMGGLRTTIKKIEDQFGIKPYGWYLAAIQCILAKLIGMGKLELLSDGNLLEDSAIERALLNTRDFINVLVSPISEPPPGDVRALKDFYGLFFAKPPEAKDARGLGRETKQGFIALYQELQQLYLNHNNYPFLAELGDVIDQIESLTKESYEYYLDDFQGQHNDWIERKEKVIDPIKNFMRGSNKDLYDQVRGFIRQQEPNFSYIQDGSVDELKQVMEDLEIYRGDKMRSIKSNFEDLEKVLDTLIEEEQSGAVTEIERVRALFEERDGIKDLPDDKVAELLKPFEQIVNRIKSMKSIPVIREAKRNFSDIEYVKLLTRLDELTSGGDGAAEDVKPIVHVSMLADYQNNVLLEDEESVDLHLKKIKTAIMKAIQEGKKVLFS